MHKAAAYGAADCSFESCLGVSSMVGSVAGEAKPHGGDPNIVAQNPLGLENISKPARSQCHGSLPI